jgi:acylphosphatase
MLFLFHEQCYVIRPEEKKEMDEKVHVMIAGRVQGVWFRAKTRQKADELGLTGWVRNTADGRVEAVFEGEHALIDQMLVWCQRGPPLAKVNAVDILSKEPATHGFQGFDIRY